MSTFVYHCILWRAVLPSLNSFLWQQIPFTNLISRGSISLSLIPPFALDDLLLISNLQLFHLCFTHFCSSHSRYVRPSLLISFFLTWRSSPTKAEIYCVAVKRDSSIDTGWKNEWETRKVKSLTRTPDKYLDLLACRGSTWLKSKRLKKTAKPFKNVEMAE